MVRSISPLLQRELANLDDASSRRSAMKALKSYVRDLDSKAIPRFLADVSDKDPGSPPGECTISLYEVLARVHGPKIVPQIDNIMSTIMRTLSSSAGSFPLHQACSRVVPAIARYAIEPSTPSDQKTRIIRTLYKPLCEALMGSQESVTTGAALCLTALVEADNWRFATDEMVNEVCLKVAGALEEKMTQTNYHMALVTALAKHNTLVAEAYARCFLRSGLQILSLGVSESNTQKRLCAIQMINCLMSCVDSRSISSELGKVIDAMEERRTDQFQFVRVAAWETLQTAKVIAGQKGSRQGILSSPRLGRRSAGATDDESTGENDGPVGFHSPESHTVDSFVRFDNFVESPKSIGQSSTNSEYARRAHRRLWANDVGGVDVSLKDGILLRSRSLSEISEVELEPHMNDEEHNDAFTGFGQIRASREARSLTPSPQRLGAQLTFDDVKLYSTPRKLVRSLQDQTYVKSRGSVLKSPTSGEVEQSIKVALCGTTHSHDLISDAKGRRRYAEKARMIGTETGDDDSGVFMDGTESASSTGDLSGNISCKICCMDCEDKNGAPRKSVRRIMFAKTTLVFGLVLIFVAIILSSMRMNNEDLYIVPT